MKRFAAFALLAFIIAGVPDCTGLSTLKDAWSGTASVTVNENSVLIARNAFVAVENTASNYLELKRCTGSNGPVCRSPAATKQIIAAVRSGRAARDNLTKFQREHPGQIGYGGALDALKAATDTLRAIFQQYKIGAS